VKRGRRAAAATAGGRIVTRAFLGILLAGLAAPGPARPEALCRQIRLVMGTALEIAVADPDSSRAAEALDAAFEEAARLERLLSHYLPESPLSRLNASAGEIVAAEPELLAYLRRAQRDGVRTDGAFDVTIAPLLSLHREGAAGADRVRQALSLIGVEKILFPAPGFVQLPRAGMRLDPGGDGKGVALDAMVGLLREHGIERAFLDFGGSSIYGLGTPPEQGGAAAAGWIVALPGGEDGGPLAAVPLRDLALSVSSSLPPSEDRDASRPASGPRSRSAPAAAHIVDPRTGDLVTVPRLVCVLSPSATDADVLSTALIVEGSAGLRWLSRFEGAACGIQEEGRWVSTSPGFLERLLQAPLDGKNPHASSPSAANLRK
jgi:thiamine biosynthesis lipoprotein